MCLGRIGKGFRFFGSLTPFFVNRLITFLCVIECLDYALKIPNCAFCKRGKRFESNVLIFKHIYLLIYHSCLAPTSDQVFKLADNHNFVDTALNFMLTS